MLRVRSLPLSCPQQQSHVAACPQRARSAKPRGGLGYAGPEWELAAPGLSSVPPAESHSRPAALPLWPRARRMTQTAIPAGLLPASSGPEPG